MINEKVYRKLIEVAKKKYKTPDGKIGIIYYEDLSIGCGLGLNLENIDDRNKLSHILGEISKYELEQEPSKPPISVLVVLKNQSPIMPSYGFFNLMDKLGVRNSKETDEKLRNRLMNWSYEYWKENE